MITLVLKIFAFVLFVIAAVWNPAAPSPWFDRLVAAGLACWVMAEILAGTPILR
jgi:hypothetical protein